MSVTTRYFPARASRTSGLPIVKWLAAIPALHAQRRALRELDAARLDDLGLTRAEAMTEAQKPLWDVPSHWLR